MSELESDIAVELWAAPLPVIGHLAEHHWLIIERADAVDRWEVWQATGLCERSWGHLHCNLMRPHRGIGGGPGWRIQRWTGVLAVDLARRIEESPRTYPWLETYRIFPGPNSNTFVQWILADAFRLGWRGAGRRYARNDPSTIATTRYRGT